MNYSQSLSCSGRGHLRKKQENDWVFYRATYDFQIASEELSPTVEYALIELNSFNV